MPANAPASSVFALPERLAAKADPALIAADERHFAAIGASLARTVADLEERLARELKMPGGSGQQALDRDQEVHRLSNRLRALRRFGLDLCLGRMVTADDAQPVYVGRLGLTDAEGDRLLIDWRSPAAEPFFGATHANPMGLASRRRYRWTRGRIGDYWDEVFEADALQGHAALDDQSAFIASLAGSRSERMRDVLGTIQADQDAIIRAGSRGALVIDGGPGTGKTVVALHRSAYLLYSDPRLARSRGGVLFVGPSGAYLDYVSDVLPSLGEDGVQLCTLRDLVPEGATAVAEPDAAVAALKASVDLVKAVERAVRLYELPPEDELLVQTEWARIVVTADDWADAFEAAESDAHNEARGEVWDELLTLLAEKHGGPTAENLVRRSLSQDAGLRRAFSRAWPVLDPVGVVADLWSSPDYLRRCAPGLSDEQVRLLQRVDARAWTDADLPLLDTARLRIGDVDAARIHRRRASALAEQREQMSHVIDNLLASHELDDGEGLMPMLRGADVQESLIDESALPSLDPDVLAGPFAHVVVDEAQELTDAEWRMLLRRSPSKSFTIVGDRAQARHGFTESWEERLARVGIARVELATLSINYRTPEEVMAVAEPAIRAALPDANVPTSIRRSGIPVVRGSTAELGAILDAWLAAHDEGIACVIGTADLEPRPRVRVLTPAGSKGLEFDLVVLVDPDSFGDGIEGAVDRYVAMTRATQQLVVLTSA